jgi:hypothetical protein
VVRGESWGIVAPARGAEQPVFRRGPSGRVQIRKIPMGQRDLFANLAPRYALSTGDVGLSEYARAFAGRTLLEQFPRVGLDAECSEKMRAPSSCYVRLRIDLFVILR